MPFNLKTIIDKDRFRGGKISYFMGHIYGHEWLRFIVDNNMSNTLGARAQQLNPLVYKWSCWSEPLKVAFLLNQVSFRVSVESLIQQVGYPILSLDLRSNPKSSLTIADFQTESLIIKKFQRRTKPVNWVLWHNRIIFWSSFEHFNII